MIDNLEENLQCNRQNGILIRTWTGDKFDKVLKDIIPVLKHIELKGSK